MRIVHGLAALALMAALFVLPPSSRAAIEQIDRTGPKSLELIVVEAPACGLCRLFRDKVLPAYKLSPRSSEALLRFVDVSRMDPAQIDLSEPIEVVPTVVLMRDGRELDRITGYTGPELFLRTVNQMLQRYE